MQRIILNEGESISGVVLSWADNGQACVFVPTEIEETKHHAYALAKREREQRQESKKE